MRLRWLKLDELPPKLAGGFLMGIGGTLVPGGNDTLLLAAIPTFSVHAVAVFAADTGVVATFLRRHYLALAHCSGCSG